MVKILDVAYAKADLKQVADNTTQINSGEITLLISLIEEFKVLFGGTLGNWSTEPVNFELKKYSKPFNSRYYPVPIINKENFRKQLERLVEIGVIRSVQQIQYVTPVFIIPKK